jgi:DNA-binding IclR family transcriptional regulator
MAPRGSSAADAVTSGVEAEPGRRQGVPAVLHTVAILRYLQETGNRPIPMTQFARALGINQSTCFNILKTLAANRILNYDEDTRRYTLGMALIELAAMVDSHGHLLRAAQIAAERVSEELNQVCLIFRKTQDDAFLVIGKAEGRGDLKVTAALGDRFPPNGAILAKSWYSWSSDEEIDHMIDLHGLPARSPKSITGMLDFKRELSRTRARGYAISVGEYYPEHNAVGCPVLDPDGRCLLLLVVTGFASKIKLKTMPEIGQRLSLAALEISEAVFGNGTLPDHD